MILLYDDIFSFIIFQLVTNPVAAKSQLYCPILLLIFVPALFSSLSQYPSGISNLILSCRGGKTDIRLVEIPYQIIHIIPYHKSTTVFGK